MATVEEEDAPERPSGIVAQVGDITYRVVEESSGVVYGRTGATLWPVVLIAVAGVALILEGAAALILGAVALVLLAVWVGAKG